MLILLLKWLKSLILFEVDESIKAIARNMEYHPDDWIVDAYRVRNLKTGMEIWIADGVAFISIEGVPALNLAEKMRLNRGIKALVASKINEKLEI